ncbi:hypothetical protein LAD64_27285 [Klebsiella pneumoniae]|nr:hypothetical protein [Klebsiella pneumoniae]
MNAAEQSNQDRLVPINCRRSRVPSVCEVCPQVGMNSPNGQQYIPQDREQVAYYQRRRRKPDSAGRGSTSWPQAHLAAAAPLTVTNNLPMIPLHLLSMFGFAYRRICLGGLAISRLAASLHLAGNFGRTTLNGEGLQHEDGHKPHSGR